MTTRSAVALGMLLVAGAAILWALFVVLPARYPTRPQPVAAPAPAAPSQAPERRITAHLFFVAADGLHLASVEQDVAYGEGTAEQARHIIEAELEPAPAPYISPIPPGTMLRALFVSERGEAFVDFTPQLRAAHPGGSLNERLTVYAIVDALTANLPAITAVQILVDGREVDSLAGHVDLRQPLRRDMEVVVGHEATGHE